MHIEPSTLESKLREMHPEIGLHGLGLSTCFDDNKDAWIVKVNKGDQMLTTHIERKDAEACLEGVQCIYLGVQIGQFIKNFEQGAKN